MKVSGSATLHASVQEVWTALNDPAVLVRTIPGCERLEEVGADRYRMTVSAGVASIKGSYQGDVALTEQEHPSRFVLRASGAGAPGTVSADVLVTLAEADGGTLLTYEADAVVGGAVGGVGQRVLAGVAKKTAGEFFRAVDDVLTGAAPALAAAEVPTPREGDQTVATTAGTQGGTPGVFTAPAPVACAGGDDATTLLKGAVFGAAVALLGVLVGGAVARRR